MNLVTIKEYLEYQKAKTYSQQGLTREDFEKELGVGPTTAKRFICKEVAAGRLKLNGKQKFLASDGRVNYRPVYTLIPHEVPNKA